MNAAGIQISADSASASRVSQKGHPTAPNRVLEMDHLKAKVDAGADYICTQLFFDNHDFLDFRARCRLAGIHVPIIAQASCPSPAPQACAAWPSSPPVPAIPQLLRAIQRCGNDEAAVQKVGIHYATEQCHDLLDHGVDGIHFYTLNKSHATREIYASLGIRDSAAVQKLA